MEKNEDKVVQIAKALSDNARVRILTEIAKRKVITCNEVTKIAGLAQPTVSHHLKILHDSGLLNSVKEGRFSNLSINYETFKNFNMMIKEIAKI